MKATPIKSAALLLLAAPCLLHAVPVQIARESFDGGGFGFTTSVPQFDEPTVATSDYFSVQPNNGTKLSGSTIVGGGDGANMFAAEDIDTNPGPLVAPVQSITFNPVNISGKTTVTARLLLAAPGSGAAQTFYDWDAGGVSTDFIRVEASVDSGPFTELAQWYPHSAGFNVALSRDTDFNGSGDGPALTAAFQEFILPVTNGGSVQVRVVMHSNATNEYLCVDNVRIFADTPATSPPSLGGVPGTALTFTEGSPATAVAPAITVTDTDSTNMASAAVTVSSGYVNGEDVLSAAPSGAIVAGDIVFNAAAGTLIITRSATKANYETVLRSVSYRNTNTTAPNTQQRQIQFRVSDGANTSNQPIRAVDVLDNLTLQAVPFVESFETDGRGTRYALDGRFTNGTAFFDRRTSLAGLTNVDGSSVIAGEDTDLNPAAVEAVRFHISTATPGLRVCSLRAAAPSGAVYDAGDLIALEVAADGGAWTPVAEFRSTAGASSTMALDTNLDGTGDGTVLTSAMQRFDFVLPPATASLALRVRIVSNTAGELLAVDRIGVTVTPDGQFIPVPGNLTHMEDFNSLPQADTAWTDHGLRKGWLAQMNNGTTAPGTLQVSDGSVALTGLVNCGTIASADRAPGSKATSIGGFANVAYAAVFKNVGELPVKLTRLRYAQELWRTGGATAEKVTTFYAISAAPLASILSGPSNAAAAAGAGFTAFDAAANTAVTSPGANLTLDGNLPANRSAVDFTLTAGTEPVVQPGQFITLKWTDTNEAGDDGQQAIDDVTVDFVQLDCSIQTTLGSVTRKPGANPTDPADDLVDFVMTVAGVGNASPLGFSIPAGNFDGSQAAYGTYLFTDVTVNQFTPLFSMTIEDRGNPACQTTATVPLPGALGLTSIGGSPQYIQATSAPAMFRQTAATEMTVDPGSGVLLTDSFALAAGTEKCLTVTLDAQDLSNGSGFDPDDTVKVELLTNSAQAPVQVLSNDYDLNADGFIGGGATPETDEWNTESQVITVKWTTSLTFAGVIPANATSFQVRVTVVLNNTSVPISEVFRVRDINLVPCQDTDGDGVHNTWELIHGTALNDPNSRFRLGSIAAAAGQMQVGIPTVTGRVYQLQRSSDLGLWARDGLPVPGNDAVQTFSSPSADPRKFLRVLVTPPQTIQP